MLDAFFHPKRVALIGASTKPGTVGASLLHNLQHPDFKGTIYPVNPGAKSLGGLACYPSIHEVPERCDLAVIATPARTVPQVIEQCGEAGIPAAIIISAGFKEIGPQGAELEAQILATARKHRMRIIGPNCLGLMNPHAGLNATFATSMARKGHIGFISQSGALCTAILDWSHRELVGFSAFVSVGSMLDAGWGDLIQYLGDDPNTRSILLYMESVGDARSFLSAAREVAFSKPVIVIKPGRTSAAAKAAQSHTGALTGADDVLDAAFRRCGALRVDTIAELFYMAEALDKQPRPSGPRLAMVTNAGGPAVLATDALLLGGGELAQLSPASIAALDAFLPPHWSHQNPVDILGDATPERFSKAVEIVSKDPGADGLLVILAPQAVTNPVEAAEALKAHAKIHGKPVIASWMGGVDVAAGEAVLNAAGIPTYAYPDSAARVFQAMWRYSANLKALYETPSRLASDPSIQSRGEAARMIESARSSGRTLLTEEESKRLLGMYGIPTVETVIAESSEDAARAAERIGFPVVVKLHSKTITHKTDVGGVILNLNTTDSVRDAFRQIQSRVAPKDFQGVTVQKMIRTDGYELILGSSLDPQFGPVILFGSGGQLVEVYKDRAIGLPPLTTTLARLLMERTKIYTALGGIRGRAPVDLEALEQLLVRFSYLLLEQTWIKEIDINPLLASPEGLVALDARVVLLPADQREIPKPAIRPYPAQYVRPWKFDDGTQVLIRPIRAEDEPLIASFHKELSERSVYQRYFHFMHLEERVAHERLVRICFSDYDREIALVAEIRNPEPEILAVGRLSKTPLTGEAELAVLITDEYQGKGLGTELTRRLLEIARIEQIERVTVSVLADNVQMRAVCHDAGFRFTRAEDGVVIGEILLNHG